jgi:hypothetical protein
VLVDEIGRPTRDTRVSAIQRRVRVSLGSPVALSPPPFVFDVVRAEGVMTEWIVSGSACGPATPLVRCVAWLRSGRRTTSTVQVGGRLGVLVATDHGERTRTAPISGPR